MGAILIAVVVVVAIYGVLSLGAYALANTKKRKFFTSPVEGTAEFVMRGNQVVKMILAWKGHAAGKTVFKAGEKPHLADPFEIEERKSSKGFWYHLVPVNWFESAWNIYWVGLYPLMKVLFYNFIWGEFTDQDKKNRQTLRIRRATDAEGGEGQTHFIYVKDFNYGIVVRAKTVEGLPLIFTLTVTVRIVNPYKALFMGEDWLVQTTAAISKMMLRYAGQLTYEEIRLGTKKPKLRVLDRDPAEGREYELGELIATLSDGKSNELYATDLRQSYGVFIVAAQTEEVEPDEEEGSTILRDGVLKEFQGRQEGLATLARAEGEAKAEVVRAEGAAQARRVAAEAQRNWIETTYTPIAGTDREKRMELARQETLRELGAKGNTSVVVPNDVVGLAASVGKIIVPPNHKKE